MMSRVATLSAVALLSLLQASATRAAGRERAIEEIPELMGRILESQEEIQQKQRELAPQVEQYESALARARQRIERADSEDEAAEALVDYVEAFDRRTELQAEGLRAIRSPIIRMRSDARELARVAELAGGAQERVADRQPYLEQQFQGIATGLQQLAGQLGRQEEAGIAGSVLQAGWASQTTPELPLMKMGPEGAAAFARRAEGLFARFQARSAQLRAERQSIRQLLDLLIERQLGNRLEALFASDDGLGTLLAVSEQAGSWEELGSVVRRAVGLPADSDEWANFDGSLDRLDFFAGGGHVQ
jgi:hypothetical protein